MKAVTQIIGTGGIGTGVFYRLEDNRTIGRDESRPAHRLPQRDYCKQHIILHYLAVLLRDLRKPIQVRPIGAVGQDPAGNELLKEMQAAGLNTDHVQRRSDASTLSAVCYLFPDGSGGNFTESQSACALVSPRFIEQSWRKIRPDKNACLVLAAPEVPLASRRRLLELGRAVGALNVASFVSQEMAELGKSKLLRQVDLLAVNRDEAAALGRVSPQLPVPKIAAACRRVAQQFNPAIQIVVTAGADGVIGLVGEQALFLPKLKVKAVNTAGAGDALLAGVMLGTLLGRPLIGPDSHTSLHLGRALAALKVASPHTINFDIHLKSLRACLRRQGESLP